MKILYTSNLYPPSIGGTQVHLHALAKEIKNGNNEVHVLVFTSRYRKDWVRLSTILSESEKHYTYEDINVSRIGFSNTTKLKMLPWAAMYYGMITRSTRRLSRYMYPYVAKLAGEPSIVHATRNGREFLSRTALDFAREKKIPFVLTPNHHPRWKGFLYSEYDKIYKEADALFALTKAEKILLMEQCDIPAEKIHVTGIGPLLSETYDAKSFRSQFGLKDRFVLYLGRQCIYKGIKAILDAAPIIWEKHPEMNFVFAGPRTSESIKLFNHINDERIVNLGTLDSQMKTSAIAACEFLCMPSTQESFGGVYVEAWSLKKAVIGGNIPPIASLVADGVDGLLSSQNIDELSDAMLVLLSSTDRCQKMGIEGWKKVQEKYTWKQLAKKTLGVYKQLYKER